MKYLFFPAVFLLILFEVANVYFIMPMPGSQLMDSHGMDHVGWAYMIYSSRWIVRIGLGLLALLGALPAFRARPKASFLMLAVLGIVAYLANFNMAADAMFRPMQEQVLAPAASNEVELSRLVIGVAHGGAASAYPIQYMGYHHFLIDTVGGQRVLVTYCTVCRTGRVFDPTIDGQALEFRLVGMDHFNAMLEDQDTKTWWRQATGEAAAGARQGKTLPEIESQQMTLGQWLALYPNSRILQPDPAFTKKYEDMSAYENGTRKGSLTRRDSLSWQPKSWVVGVQYGEQSMAFDWNELDKQRILYGRFPEVPIAVVLAPDNKSFSALRLQDMHQLLAWRGDTLVDSLGRYDLLGRSYDAGVPDLKRLPAYQEYWHSWQTFHPETTHN
jgi:hypothetical protein